MRRKEGLGEVPRQSRLSRSAYGEVTTDLGGNHEIVESWKPGEDRVRKWEVVISFDWS